jgi:anti-sigma regulatory factor (Ser/Thr protein kinase)
MARLALNLPPVPSSVPHSRHRVGAWLDDTGVEIDPAARDDVLVVVTELVTNGVLHDGDAPIAVFADTDQHAVRIDVETMDRPNTGAAATPDWRDPAESGRGLAMVGALSRDLKTEVRDGCRRVSCRVPCRPHHKRDAARSS